MVDEGRNIGQRFPASLRIKRSAEFAIVFRRGKVAADAVLVVHALPDETGARVTRIGMSLSKKIGCAPLRNRWKRLIREAFRQNRSRLPAGLRLVVRPRKGAIADYRAVEASLIHLSNRLARVGRVGR